MEVAAAAAAAAAAGSRVAAGGADGTDAAGSPMPTAYGAERRTQVQIEPINDRNGREKSKSRFIIKH